MSFWACTISCPKRQSSTGRANGYVPPLGLSLDGNLPSWVRGDGVTFEITDVEFKRSSLRTSEPRCSGFISDSRTLCSAASRLASLPGGSHSVGGRTYFERPRTRRILRPLESHQYKKADVDGCVRQMAIPYLPGRRLL
ncbi:unnamed protein product [Prunus armeniaca]|uniref:Uncharacterized protein n=1 Tax=Prunus armeniaca TaxID=36596 RepID=A0A6J5WT14_PRUAR|nr:unnamed protein product [Prunus armeniaca]CAB4286188.1 unnamed protein product [Prunus armeniaca]CAB4302812.1 unnamed protein product [Prunus armeniaca]